MQCLTAHQVFYLFRIFCRSQLMKLFSKLYLWRLTIMDICFVPYWR